MKECAFVREMNAISQFSDFLQNLRFVESPVSWARPSANFNKMPRIPSFPEFTDGETKNDSRRDQK